MVRKHRYLVFSLVFLVCAVTSALAAEQGYGGTASEMTMTHRMMVLALQLGCILFVAKLSAALFEKMRLPGVLGEIAGGIVVGPFLMGNLPLPGLPQGLFPLIGEFPVSPELYGFCSVAAIVLLFDAGLETDVGLFMRYSVAGSLVGIGGVVLSFVLGDLTAVWFSHLLSIETLTFMSPPALFLGVMSTATSVGITARILSQRGKIDSPEGVTILAGAVIDDVLGIILLAVSMGIITASRSTGSIDWTHIGIISGKAIGIWLVATVVGLTAAHRFSSLLKLFRDRRTVATLALGLGLILAGLFEEAGLAMIIGAYVMGLSLSRTDICHLVREKLEPIAALLVPVFFVVMGMLVDIRLFASPGVLAFGAIYTAIAVFAKVGGCAVPALATGFNTRGALRIGVGMLPRGEVALIVAGIGLASRVVGKDVFGVGVLMTLATTLLAPPILVGLLKGDVPGTRRPFCGTKIEPLRVTFPSSESADMLVAKLLKVFEDDGFFVHTLDGNAGIHQVRKNASVATLRREGLTLLVHCSDSDRAFVHTAILEVASDLRRMAEEMAKPIDREALADSAAESPHPTFSFPLGAHMAVAAMSPRLDGVGKDEIIGELVRLAARGGGVRDPQAAQTAVMRREAAGSTGMQHGIALPHGKTDTVDHVVCAVGLKPEGVDFDSLDGESCRIFVLVLSPARVTGPHIRFLASLSQVLDEEGRSALLECETAGEMYSLLSGFGRHERRAIGRHRDATA